MAYNQILNFNQINNEPRINKKVAGFVVEYISADQICSS